MVVAASRGGAGGCPRTTSTSQAVPASDGPARPRRGVRRRHRAPGRRPERRCVEDARRGADRRHRPSAAGCSGGRRRGRPEPAGGRASSAGSEATLGVAGSTTTSSSTPSTASPSTRTADSWTTTAPRWSREHGGGLRRPAATGGPADRGRAEGPAGVRRQPARQPDLRLSVPAPGKSAPRVPRGDAPAPGRVPLEGRADPRLARALPARGGRASWSRRSSTAPRPRSATSWATCCSRCTSTPCSPSRPATFTIDDVAAGVTAKMRRRNPHVFDPASLGRPADAPPLTAAEVDEIYQSVKRTERGDLKRAMQPRPHDGRRPVHVHARLTARPVGHARTRNSVPVTGGRPLGRRGGCH